MKKKKDKTGRVVLVSRENNVLLKRYFAYNESIGVTLTNSEICDKIFSTGLLFLTKDMPND